MATNLLLRRGTAAEAAAYTGGEGELFVDLDNNKVYIHDGVTVGGYVVTGIDLASFSVGPEGTASGDGSIAYDNTTGVYTYTPPDLSGYTLSSSLATVATSGSYNDLSDTPSLFSGSYNDLTDVPTIPSVLTDLSISDGTSGQILTTDGLGNFSFTTISGISNTLDGLTDVTITSIADGEALVFDSGTSSWINATRVTLTDLSVGVDGAASGSGAITYDNTSGVFTYTPPDLSGYALSSGLSTVATSGSYTDLTDKPTLYTDSDTASYLSTNGYDTATNIIASITDSAPTTLDTLNELAAALGDDPNFATTVTDSIATKAPLSNPNFTGTVTATTFSGALSGNAATATKWQTARTISLTGDVTGTSGSFDGTANLSFATNIAANTVGANELNVSGNGTAGQSLTSDGDGSFSWADGGFPSGTKMLFRQTTAPTGWTKDTSAAINDSILRAITGTVSSGGSTAFSTYNAVTTTGAHTLSTAQIPSHTHTYLSAYKGNEASGLYSEGGYGIVTRTTNATGGGGSHSHTISRNIKYYDVIVATKD